MENIAMSHRMLLRNTLLRNPVHFNYLPSSKPRITAVVVEGRDKANLTSVLLPQQICFCVISVSLAVC